MEFDFDKRNQSFTNLKIEEKNKKEKTQLKWQYRKS